MSEKSIPSNAPSLSVAVTNEKREDSQELKLLGLEATLKGLANREIGQRYLIKWIAIGTGVGVILCMFGILVHMFHQFLWGPFIAASPALSVAMIVAPIVSITTITVAIFIGAFRKFEEKDLEALGNGTLGALNAFKTNS